MILLQTLSKLYAYVLFFQKYTFVQLCVILC